MDKQKGGIGSIDEYISLFPADVQSLLQEVRATIRASAPGAVERISYQMPAFALHGNLVYFAALKDSIGFYMPLAASRHSRTSCRHMKARKAR